MKISFFFYDFLWFYSFHRLPKWMWRFKMPTPERKNYLNNWWSLVYFLSFGSRVFLYFFLLLGPQFFLYFTTKYIFHSFLSKKKYINDVRFFESFLIPLPRKHLTSYVNVPLSNFKVKQLIRYFVLCNFMYVLYFGIK